LNTIMKTPHSVYRTIFQEKKKDATFDSSHLYSKVAVISPTDYTLWDTRFSQQYCWFKSSEISSHQLVHNYWCFEGSYCLHSLGQEEGTTILHNSGKHLPINKA
jgi:hypothetical protein